MLSIVRHIVTGISLFAAATAGAQTAPKWWWELHSSAGTTNQPVAIQGTDCASSCTSSNMTAAASGAGVQLNKSLISQPAFVVIGDPTGGLGYTVTAANPAARDVQVAVTDNKQQITRSTANTYFITLRNMSAATVPVRLTLSYRGAGYSPTPTPTFSNPVCSSIPAGSTCSVTGATSANLSLAGGATATVQWAASNIGATTTRIQVDALAVLTDGSSDATPGDNAVYDQTQIN